MKKSIVLLTLFLLLLGCKEHERRAKIQGGLGKAESTAKSDVVDEVTDGRDYHEYSENFNSRLVKHFDVEGNFTNSGNREFVAFYQIKNGIWREGEKYDEIDYAYCFVLDKTNEKVQKTYEFSPRYFTIPFYSFTENDIDEDPMEELGRDVTWLGKRIGCIGDFNENGKEELYLFCSFGLGIDPFFYEFNGIEFVEITDDNRYFTFCRVAGVDKENKIIHFERTSRATRNFSAIWNAETQRYEVIKDEE